MGRKELYPKRPSERPENKIFLAKIETILEHETACHFQKKHIAMVPMVFTFIGFFEGMIDMRMKSCFSSIELVVSRNPATFEG